MSVAFIITALVIGLGGSIHCIAMCGPLVMSMPFQFASHKAPAIAAYIFFKSLAYGCQGIVMGFVGQAFSLLSLQSMLCLVVACFMLITMIFPVIHRKIKLPGWANALFGKTFHQLIEKPRLHWFALFGFLNGWLPCGVVLSALAVAAVPASPLQGFVFMFLFGIATSPVLISIIVFKRFITGKRKRFFNSLSRAAMFLVVLLLCWRAFAIHVNQRENGHGVIFCTPEIIR